MDDEHVRVMGPDGMFSILGGVEHADSEEANRDRELEAVRVRLKQGIQKDNLVA